MLARVPEMPTAVVNGHTVHTPTVEHKNFSWHMPLDVSVLSI
jgi:hypothetical protein